MNVRHACVSTNAAGAHRLGLQGRQTKYATKNCNKKEKKVCKLEARQECFEIPKVVAAKSCINDVATKCYAQQGQHCFTVEKTLCGPEPREVGLDVPDTTCKITPREIAKQICTPRPRHQCFTVSCLLHAGYY